VIFTSTRTRSFLFYDDGAYPLKYEIADFQELLRGNAAARFLQEIALHVAKSEMADLNPAHNKGRHDELDKLDKLIRSLQKGLHNQDLKAAFVQGKIDALRKN
jgi:hypothetical protein